MSGHSKWSTIKHGKAITDARRGKLFTKLAKEVIIAAREGGGDPGVNFRLRMAVQKAKDQNMPGENIERAIKKATGEGDDGAQMIEALYEGYGPGGVAILLETLTDNRNRTVSDVRSTLTKAGGNLAEAGAVAWQFEQKGVIMVETAEDQAEELALIAIDEGADDFETYDSTLEIFSTPGSLESIRTTLEQNEAKINSSEVSMVPSHTIELDDRAAIQTLKLLDKLEDLDDVQKVYSNADFSDEALDQYGAETA
ncbi:MAG: YebC/PmpR family DNA-binding transcriptional regulator [SAR202 cluster bacterium]|jgi:YebC/PmpR family DNA-binding regulatory protein|nr:YebC/PmpR family DNA-binding transcriptional regulator [Chloroflexota bacterium]MDP6420192.1 YebC/PmpR family DNA-binding transcriptional regulator [SAR202 cluster bacterium]HAL47727.1 YebC/PmpR family DNA-binding transcriptional regulator [Dehalococcoidia bacterium]MDP6664684.1 YebC/PmpR family DNA-binding transcriptional regulator [SAR202 cluster bacterium]MDP6800839.1 YebC/PmpR family DNA-binding transcriptional regulator [SAR202 cluster bacterium]|tara:strand:+ start:1203 stop:1964 length:762 start_codon:yes stop_codon:yes gene_type:complete